VDDLEGWERLIHGTIMEAYGNSTTKNIILGSEELDRFGETPWSNRDGLSAIQKLIDLLHPESIDLVVNYRRPRSHQWISIWKQLMRKEKVVPTYSDYLCRMQNREMLWEYLDCVSNPLGLASALLQKFGTIVKVHILDMQEIEAANQDVSHVLACSILKVDCTGNGFVKGMDHQPRLNQRFGNPGLAQQQLEEMEWLFLQRDCTFQDSLLHHNNLEIHFDKDKLFSHCPISTNPQFANTTMLLDLFQSQVGCGLPSYKEKVHALVREYDTTSTTDVKTVHHPTSQDASYGDMSNQSLLQSALKLQLYIIVGFMYLFGCFLFRRVKCKSQMTNKR
jgi:hypothetical protein